MNADAEREFLTHTLRDDRTLACPLCEHTVDVPPVPVMPAVGEALGMSGQTLAMVHGEQSVKRAVAAMREHLANHEVMDWLARVSAPIWARPDATGSAATGPVCSLCRRQRGLTGMDPVDYSSLQVMTGQPVGWYSGDDGEMCPECMTKSLRGGL